MGNPKCDCTEENKCLNYHVFGRRSLMINKPKSHIVSLLYPVPHDNPKYIPKVSPSSMAFLQTAFLLNLPIFHITQISWRDQKISNRYDLFLVMWNKSPKWDTKPCRIRLWSSSCCLCSSSAAWPQMNAAYVSLSVEGKKCLGWNILQYIFPLQYDVLIYIYCRYIISSTQ